MTDIAQLRALEDRLSKATGPDRELDLAIATALVPDVIVMRQRDDDSGSDPYTYWEYTASLDAAVALCERVLPGCDWQFCKSGEGTLIYGSSEYEPLCVGAKAASVPLAFCLAIVRALIAQENGG